MQPGQGKRPRVWKRERPRPNWFVTYSETRSLESILAYNGLADPVTKYV